LKTIVEKKGIDLVKREWCKISKEAGLTVLDILLNKNLVEDEKFDQIYLYFEELNNGLYNRDLSDFIITMQLNKSPKSYNMESKPAHVVVAERMILRGVNV
jgi:DNA polymerase alpha subunit A